MHSNYALNWSNAYNQVKEKKDSLFWNGRSKLKQSNTTEPTWYTIASDELNSRSFQSLIILKNTILFLISRVIVTLY